MKMFKLFIWVLGINSIVYGEEIETATVNLSPKVKLIFQAEKINDENRETFGDICIFRDQLWYGASAKPPYNILVKGELNLNGQKIALDVSGLATPWITPDELKKGECRLRKMEKCYELQVGFLKGGVYDYIVTWLIYKNKSIRLKIENTGDTYPDWIKQN